MHWNIYVRFLWFVCVRIWQSKLALAPVGLTHRATQGTVPSGRERADHSQQRLCYSAGSPAGQYDYQTTSLTSVGFGEESSGHLLCSLAHSGDAAVWTPEVHQLLWGWGGSLPYSSPCFQRLKLTSWTCWYKLHCPCAKTDVHSPGLEVTHLPQVLTERVPQIFTSSLKGPAQSMANQSRQCEKDGSSGWNFRKGKKMSCLCISRKVQPPSQRKDFSLEKQQMLSSAWKQKAGFRSHPGMMTEKSQSKTSMLTSCFIFQGV